MHSAFGLACLFVSCSSFKANVKPAEDIAIVSEKPISEKGYSFDAARPYLPPVSGLGNNLSAGGATYSVYVPAGFKPWPAGVIILVPDGDSAEEFALSELGRTWMASADANSFALGFVQSGEGGHLAFAMTFETRRNGKRVKEEVALVSGALAMPAWFVGNTGEDGRFAAVSYLTESGVPLVEFMAAARSPFCL